MELFWRWTTLVIFMLISHLSVTHNLDSKWSSNLYKNQKSLSESEDYTNNNNNNKFRITENNIELEQASTKSNNIKRSTEEQEQKPIVDESNKPHSRQKRLIWITDDGRLALPPGTTLSISPTIALPFVRYPPSGFLSNMTVSLPLTSK